jgi:peptidoglycan/LPS O-acetylase OafA/YrhL
MNIRFNAFDGLRGVAALIVVVAHFIEDGPIKSFFLLNLLTDAKIAVGIFFILSGHVLCKKSAIHIFNCNIAYWYLCKLILARFLRLAFPVFGITALVFLVHPLIYRSTIEDLPWNIFVDFYNFDREIIDIVYYPFFDVFFLAEFKRNYIPPSWTLRPELFGSILILIFPWGKLVESWKTTFFLIMTATFLVGAYGVFPFIYYFGFFLAGAAIKFMPSRVPYLALIVLLLLVFRTTLNYYKIWFYFFDYIVSLSLVLLVYQHKIIQSFFSSRIFIFLGKVSYPMYLVHIPMIALVVPRLSEFNPFIWSHSLFKAYLFICFIILLMILSWLLISLDRAAILISKKIKS